VIPELDIARLGDKALHRIWRRRDDPREVKFDLLAQNVKRGEVWTEIKKNNPGIVQKAQWGAVDSNTATTENDGAIVRYRRPRRRGSLRSLAAIRSRTSASIWAPWRRRRYENQRSLQPRSNPELDIARLGDKITAPHLETTRRSARSKV